MSFRRPSTQRAPAAHTSWNGVADWYKDHLKERGDYQHGLIFPKTLGLLDPKTGGTYIDLACGEGSFLERIGQKIKRGTLYGVDAAPKLVEQAKRRMSLLTSCKTILSVGDVSKKLEGLPLQTADGITCLLALQNIEQVEGPLHVANSLLKPQGRLVFVINHPCFRQPRQSGWGWDEQRKLQYRRIDRYKSNYDMPILAHPGSDPSISTPSYHRPLEVYLNALSSAGFSLDRFEEWTSHKMSTSGPRAKAENVAREEIPLFLAIRAVKR